MVLIEASIIALQGDFGPWTFCILAIVIFPITRKLQSFYVGASQQRLIGLLAIVLYIILGLLFSSILNGRVQETWAEEDRIRLMDKPKEDLIVCFLQGRAESFKFKNVNYILCDGKFYNQDEKEIVPINQLEVLKKHNKSLKQDK